ncbi:MAG: HlyD family type I secretion periplasmic adaptor subunit [Bosea sp. (in: a-proteobacteria)]
MNIQVPVQTLEASKLDRPGLPPAKERAQRSHRAIARRSRWFGYTVLALFLGTFGAWSAFATIGGAVIAPAIFVVDSNSKKVQHQTGGIVGELRIREGDQVSAGDLLIRLDDTVARANLQIITRQQDEMAARTARLEAERDQFSVLQMPASLGTRLAEPEIAALMSDETRLFTIRASARDGVRSQLQKRVGQLRSEIAGYSGQRDAKIKEHELIQRDLVGVRSLYRQNLVQISRLSQLEREAASLEGVRGQLTAQMAQAEGKIAEIELQILQVVEDLRAEAMKELREIQARSGELTERKVAAEDQMKRVDIRAPVSGYVHQMQTHTVGGVISAAEPAMMIVPSGEALQLEARVATPDYDQVSLGQTVLVRLHAFNQRTTPELNGIVNRMSADVTREQQTGQTFFNIRVSLPPAELERIAPMKVAAGMTADVYLQTGGRTPFSYLVRPITDQFAKAFRER